MIYRCFNHSPIPMLSLCIVMFMISCTPKPPIPIDYLGQKPPGMVAELFAPGIISTPLYEHCAPAFAPDGSTVLWTVVDSQYRSHMMEMKFEDGQWSKPGRPTFADSTADDYYPSFSSDGKKLYFSSRRKVPSGYPETRDMRIWVVERKMKTWGAPMPFDTTASPGQEYAHSLSKDGNVYISSPLDGGSSFNIRTSKKLNGSYTQSALLPFNINSVGYEDGPYIAPDESFLIFESDRPESAGGSIDLYISFKKEIDQWSLPVNMGPKINTGASERFARLSPDGKYLFFGSSRNQSSTNRGFDIFWIDAGVIDELRTDMNAHTVIEQPLGDQIIQNLSKDELETTSINLNRWLTKYPNNLDAIILYSSALRKQQKYSEAEQLLSQHTSRWPENTKILMESALVNFGLDNNEKAVGILSPVMSPGNQLREQYIYLSNALLDMQKLKISDEYFDKAMDIFPSSFPYFNRARTLARMGEKDRAFEALDKAIRHAGITSRSVYETNADLESIKSDVRWKLLMQKLK